MTSSCSDHSDKNLFHQFPFTTYFYRDNVGQINYPRLLTRYVILIQSIGAFDTVSHHKYVVLLIQLLLLQFVSIFAIVDNSDSPISQLLSSNNIYKHTASTINQCTKHFHRIFTLILSQYGLFFFYVRNMQMFHLGTLTCICM